MAIIYQKEREHKKFSFFFKISMIAAIKLFNQSQTKRIIQSLMHVL